MEGGDGREMRKTLQSVRDRSRQLLRMVKEDLAGNLEAYSASHLPSVEKSKLALEEKCESRAEGQRSFSYAL